MPYVPTTWVNETPQSTPIKYEIVDDSNGEIAGSATITPVTPITPGTPVDATRMNKIEQGIATAIHYNQPGEISLAAEKTAADDNDLLLLEDPDLTFAKYRMTVKNLLRPYGVILSRTGVTVPSGFNTVINLTTVVRDPYSMYGSGGVSITVPGMYLVTAHVSFESFVAGWRKVTLDLGRPVVNISQCLPAVDGAATEMTVVGMSYIDPGLGQSGVSLFAHHTAGVNLSVTARLAVQRVG